MTKRQAYYTLYFLLEKQFMCLHPESEDHVIFGLGLLLDDMSPYIRTDHCSSDPATMLDFYDSWEKVGAGESVSEEKALEACFEFVNLHIIEWEFKLDEALSCLKTVDWKRSAQKFCALYPADDMDIPDDNPFIEDAGQGKLFDDEES